MPKLEQQFGLGQIEEPNNNLPFGFKWERIVTYAQTFGGWTALSAILNQWFLKVHFEKPGANSGWNWIDPTTVDYVNISRNDKKVSITIDYTLISSVGNAIDSENGHDNTYNLFTTSGQGAFDGESYLINNGYNVESSSGSNEQPSNYAALYAMKKNQFKVEVVSGSTENTYALSIPQTDVKWYLPASGQFVNVPSDMNGKQYWSSTAINDNANAYSWNGAANSTPRMDNHYVRAVRVKD